MRISIIIVNDNRGRAGISSIVDVAVYEKAARSTRSRGRIAAAGIRFEIRGRRHSSLFTATILLPCETLQRQIFVFISADQGVRTSSS